ncbi:MAG: bifunctional 5,10-methylenetetrahydrofolate dehydrogenase/5,10-methenyltetrahydrofolate cyclohydrolase [Bacteroidales bacterium]|jgi:5,10-methylene-tetrahydrofolate dehydrogenase/methenyl tetrahydrofolate cyclohydrolase|nr:bifunctional 5,10-methylenetetrahydrofolate dehydrogenase/5,10-methenyltetrahydrofolate cyclohydrolase [Bacteroidales bacterium]MCK9497928.1 bifunctional 5,10-methylenetetrahydrofolate dehydrogenase/5,10-methenyltetrahydrofolate cyclohydrolase [Bacteroidales bacterium]MDY0314599.1 bifunctional 5,10-methylenetetrahydrofolate dehydrogenase/5,10-methenyltetrahydrofolate cyclohydrolase [Bacteroidales bacterium]NLB86753.1 bifunctional 5,10-methylenetetrahydrofolate dehydrogenase/5,10-methenyltetra
MENSYFDKILNVKHLVEKYDIPVIECSQTFYEKHGIKPCLAVILTNEDPGSLSYTKGIIRFCNKNKIICRDYKVNSSQELVETIKTLNNDNEVHGIMVMYPTEYVEKDTVFMNMINPLKDVEGLHYSYLGYLVQFEKFRDPEHLQRLVIPPTAKGILSIFKRYCLDYQEFFNERAFYPENVKSNPFDLEGKRITIINDSLAVGRSLALMMLNENAYVQICHQYTPFEKVLESVSLSDIIISAVPSQNFKIPTDYVPKNSIVIDISFNGNFDYPSIFDKVYKIAPRWDLVEKNNRINDMTLNRLISNLQYLVNSALPEDDLRKMKQF